jgi:short subunit dehydrogenase-like uncharacterized protein
MKKLMIYCSTGYTGRMAADHASAAGTPLIVAGRDEAALAATLDVEYRVFELEDTRVIDRWTMSAFFSIARVRSSGPPAR